MNAFYKNIGVLVPSNPIGNVGKPTVLKGFQDATKKVDFQGSGTNIHAHSLSLYDEMDGMLVLSSFIRHRGKSIDLTEVNGSGVPGPIISIKKLVQNTHMDIHG